MFTAQFSISDLVTTTPDIFGGLLSPNMNITDALRTMLQSPSATTGEEALWKSPDFPGLVLSMRTPDINALLGMAWFCRC
jgi:hypothetical protein